MHSGDVKHNSFILASPSLDEFETSKLPAIFYIKGTQEAQDLLYCVTIAVVSSSVFILYYIGDESASGRKHLLFLH